MCSAAYLLSDKCGYCEYFGGCEGGGGGGMRALCVHCCWFFFAEIVNNICRVDGNLE